MKDFLSSTQRETLRERHRHERDGRVRDRIKAVLLSDKGWSYRHIAEALMLDEETVSLHVVDYKNQEKLTPQNGGSSSKLDVAQSAELISHLEDNTYLKVNQICAYVKEKYGVKYTVPGMTSWLHEHDFSYKKPKGTPAKADPLKQEAFIATYEELLNTTPEDEPILFADGVHPTMATKITYGWIKKGTSKLIATTASRTRINLMGALNLETMQVTVGSYETLDSEAMSQYFTQLRQSYPKAPRLHVILDQGPYNVSFVTRNAAQKQGIVLHYLPPYSPNLNPIERLWKVMNEHVRNNRFFTSVRQFKEDINNFFQVTWPQIAFSMTDRINDNFQRLKSVS
jgi:transposase